MAKTEVLLISPDFIRATTNISNNLQDKYLHSAIREATDIDFEEIIGGKMLKNIKKLVESGRINDIDNIQYKDLLDNAKYFLAYSAISRVVVISSAKIDNFGINQADDEHINALDIREMFQLEKYYTNKADTYKKRLQDYILKNISLYPDLYGNWYDTKANLHSAASTSIWLGGPRGKAFAPVVRLADKYEYKKYC